MNLKRYLGLWAAPALAASFLVGAPAWAQVAPNLGTAAPFAVLGTNATPIIGTVTCTTSTINGDVGSTFNAITNTGCTINGTVTAPVPSSVVTDFNAAYNSINDTTAPCTGTIPTTTATLGPGVYCSAAGTTITSETITLNGNASDLFIFRVGTGGLGALTLTSARIVMGGSAQACNVFIKTAEAATFTTTSSVVGTVLSGAGFTMSGATLVGRGFATTDVALTNSTVSFAGCAAPATVTVNKDFIPNIAGAVQVGLTCTSGTVTNSPIFVSEAAPGIFNVGGASAGATCTASEVVPAGYTANQSGCAAVPIGGSCTIINTLIGGGGPGAGLPAQVPTLSEWAMILLAGMLALAGFAALRRRGQ